MKNNDVLIIPNSVVGEKAAERYEMIDGFMKEQNQWVCYLNKDTIVNPETGETAYNDNPSTWGCFESACKFIDSHKGFVLGYELGEKSSITAVHIGNCITPEHMVKSFHIKQIISSMSSYFEIDLHGNGITFLSGNGGQRTLVDQLKDNKISKDGIEIELFDFNQCIPLTGLFCFTDEYQKEGISPALQFNEKASLCYCPQPIDLIYMHFFETESMEIENKKLNNVDVVDDLKSIDPSLKRKLNYLLQTNQYFKSLWYRTQPSDRGKEYDDINFIARIYSKISTKYEEIKTIFMSSPYFEAKDGKEAKMFSGKWQRIHPKLKGLARKKTKSEENDTVCDPSVNRIVAKAIELSKTDGFMDYDNDLRLLLDPLYETAIELDTDIDCSKLFISVYGDRITFCSEDNCWFIYNGQYWERENNNDLEHLRKFGGELTNRLESVLRWCNFPNDKKKSLRSQVKKFSNVTSFKRILAAARSVSPVGAGVFNAKNNLLKVKNGTIDLRTGKLKPDNPNDLFTICANANYYRSLPEPRIFKKFLNEIFEADKDLIDYVHRLLGYCITGETKEQLFFVFYGTGANGKSTLINILQSVLSDYVGSFDSYALAKKDEGSGRANPTLIQNRYCRLVTVSEKNDRSELDISLIKSITGGEKINTRMLFQNNLKPFAPMYKIIFTANKLPKIDWDDYGIRRRYRVIPFNKTIKPEDIDLDLETKILANEKETILKWLADGAKKYYKSGLGEEPLAVKKALFIARYNNNEDSIFAYANDRIDTTENENDTIQSSDIERDYQAWCEKHELQAAAKNVLGRKLVNILGVEKKMKTAKRCMYYIGVRFKEETDKSEQNKITASEDDK